MSAMLFILPAISSVSLIAGLALAAYHIGARRHRRPVPTILKPGDAAAARIRL